MHIQDLAKRLGAAVDPAADVEITGAGTLEDAGPTEVTFLANAKYEPKVKDSRAGAVLVTPDFKGLGEGAKAPHPLRIANPYLAFAKALELFHRPVRPPKGVHPTAIVGTGCTIGKDVAVGPYAVVGDGVKLGDGTILHAHAVLYEGAELGPGCEIHAHAVVRERVRLGKNVILQNGAVVGADGFGFAPAGGGRWHKIPQTGTVTLADDVEIQANACVDRATVGATTIARGTKIDNLVQVGHGSKVGEDTLLCGQAGLAGSTDVGDRVTFAGQAGAAGHIRIGNDVKVAAQTGIHTSLEKAGTYGGTPAMEGREYAVMLLNLQSFPDLFARVKELEKKAAAPAS